MKNSILTSIGIFLLLAELCFAQTEFELDEYTYDRLVRNAENIVLNDYGAGLANLGDNYFEAYEKTFFEIDVHRVFSSLDVIVPNDIDPSGGEARYISIETYTSNLITHYKRNGILIETAIDRKTPTRLYVERTGAEYLFAKVVFDRKVSGKPDYNKEIDRSFKMDVYLKFEFIGEDGLNENPIIYSIRLHEEETYNFQPVRIKGEKTTESNHVAKDVLKENSSPVVQPSPKGVTESVQKSDCEIRNRFVEFSAKQDWESFYKKHPTYLRLVGKNTRGYARASFIVFASGKVDPLSISYGVDGIESQSTLEAVKVVVEKILIDYSNEYGLLPALQDCRPIDSRFNVSLSFEQIPCSESRKGPTFNGEVGFSDAWKKYLYQTDEYRDAISNGALGLFDVRFKLNFDGTINESSINVIPLSEYAGFGDLDKAIKKALMESANDLEMWTPLYKDCIPKDAKVPINKILFNKTIAEIEPECNEPGRPAKYVSSSLTEHTDAWKEYYTSSKRYSDGVVSGLSRSAQVTFIVDELGSVKKESIELNRESDQFTADLKDIVIDLVYASQFEGGWIPALENCKKVAQRVQKTIVFKEPSITPPNRILGPPMKKSVSDVDSERNKVIQQDSKCQKENRKPRFNSCSNHKKAWRDFISNDKDYVSAIFQYGVRGPVDVRFTVRKDGNIEKGSIKVRLGDGVIKRHLAKETAQKLAESSAEYKAGWIPGAKEGNEIHKRISAHIKFSPRSVNPEAALASGLLTEKETKRMRKRADWLTLKEERKGRFSFSLEGTYTVSPMGNTINPALAIGGFFNDFVGMEVKLRHFFSTRDRVKENWFSLQGQIRNPSNNDIATHGNTMSFHYDQLSIGFLFNTSSGRVRPYFPIRFGLALGTVSGRVESSIGHGVLDKSYIRVGAHLSTGFGLDFKVGNRFSIFIVSEPYADWTEWPGEIWVTWNTGSGPVRDENLNTNLSFWEFGINSSLGIRFSNW